MDNTNNLQMNNRKDRHGPNNPMYGRHHTEIAKRKQSEAAIKRNQLYKRAITNQHHLTMDEFLGSQPIREYISKIIREEIVKAIWKE